jgi:acetyl-CoA carboxylase biotin carboxyl carrier protein
VRSTVTGAPAPPPDAVSGKEQGNRNDLDAATMQLVLKETKDLVRSLEGTETTRVRVQAGAFQIEVERGPTGRGRAIHAEEGAAAVPAPAPTSVVAPGVMPVVAPLVGVFYRAPSPGAPPFVKVGDTVERGQKVAIIEAMKLINEVTSDHHGVVAEILVENGEAVQYEQRLMLIDTTGTPAA